MKYAGIVLLTLLTTQCHVVTPIHPPATPSILGPFISASNFPRDLYGAVDTRPGTWGHAEAQAMTLTFRPPTGYRVKILSIHGDVLSWIKALPTDSLPGANAAAGTLVSFQTTMPSSSPRCDYCADNTMVYVQDDVAVEPHRASYDRENLDTLLMPDNKMLITLASWLNTTGYPIHVEATYVVKYAWVQVP